MFRKIISLILSFCFLFQQTGFVQAAAVELNLSNYFARMASSMAVDSFRPVHLRYFSYDSLNNSFKVLLDKGTDPKQTEQKLKEETKELLKYFLIGITLPNDKFWVNLRPDSPSQIIDFNLEETDIGKIMLEADLQLKKDTAQFTSPQTPEGKEYWNRLYKKAEELYGTENITIPTLTRPWIIPNEIIVRETKDSAYIYKATLKVMLESDYLRNGSLQENRSYVFKDSRAKALNEYSSQLIRELIIPKLTKEVNLSKRYAPLRQVYYSLILSRWFKSRFYGKSGVYASLIDKNDLTNLTSKDTWSKSTYFNQYKKSFAQGEYNIKEPVYTPSGQTIRSYFSGGINVTSSAITIMGYNITNPLFNLHNVLAAERSSVSFIGDLNGNLTIGAGSPIQRTTNTLRTNLINGLREQDYLSNSTLLKTLEIWVESITPPFKEQMPSFSDEDTITILNAFIFAVNSMQESDMKKDATTYLEKAKESINTFITEYLRKRMHKDWLGAQRIDSIKNAALVPFKYIRADMTLLPEEWTGQKMVQMSDAISGVVRTALDIAAGVTTTGQNTVTLQLDMAATQKIILETPVDLSKELGNFNPLSLSSIAEQKKLTKILDDLIAELQVLKDTSIATEREDVRLEQLATIKSALERIEITVNTMQEEREDTLRVRYSSQLAYSSFINFLVATINKVDKVLVETGQLSPEAAGQAQERASSAVQIGDAIGQCERSLNIWFSRLKNSELTAADISTAENIMGEFKIVKEALRTNAKEAINFLMNFLERDIILRLSQADRTDLVEQAEQKDRAALLKMFPMLPESIIMRPESRRLIEASRLLLEQAKGFAQSELSAIDSLARGVKESGEVPGDEASIYLLTSRTAEAFQEILGRNPEIKDVLFVFNKTGPNDNYLAIAKGYARSLLTREKQAGSPQASSAVRIVTQDELNYARRTFMLMEQVIIEAEEQGKRYSIMGMGMSRKFGHIVVSLLSDKYVPDTEAPFLDQDVAKFILSQNIEDLERLAQLFNKHHSAQYDYQEREKTNRDALVIALNEYSGTGNEIYGLNSDKDGEIFKITAYPKARGASSALKKDLADQIVDHISSRADSDYSTSDLLERDFSGISRRDRKEITMILKRSTRGNLPYDRGVRDSLKKYLNKSSSSLLASTNDQRTTNNEQKGASSAVGLEHKREIITDTPVFLSQAIADFIGKTKTLLNDAQRWQLREKNDGLKEQLNTAESLSIETGKEDVIEHQLDIIKTTLENINGIITSLREQRKDALTIDYNLSNAFDSIILFISSTVKEIKNIQKPGRELAAAVAAYPNAARASSAVEVDEEISGMMVRIQGNLYAWQEWFKKFSSQRSGLTADDRLSVEKIIGEFEYLKGEFKVAAGLKKMSSKGKIEFLTNYLQREIIWRLSEDERAGEDDKLLKVFKLFSTVIRDSAESNRLLMGVLAELEILKQEMGKIPETAASSAVKQQGFRQSELNVIDSLARGVKESGVVLEDEAFIYLLTSRTVEAFREILGRNPEIEDVLFVFKKTGPDDNYLAIARDYARSLLLREKKISSPIVPTNTGGIDFKHKALASATTYKAMGSFVGLDFSLPKLSSQALLSFNLDKEQSDISRAIDNGIIVSGQRIKEFMSASNAKGQLDQRRETVITWLAKLGILEETTCCAQESSKEYREALVIVDSAVI